jgi:uncharacterized protein (DUF58 family)
VEERVGAVEKALRGVGKANVETAVTYLASLVVALLKRGCDVGLATLDGRVELGNGKRQRRELLDHLARMELRDDAGSGLLALPDRSTGVECLLIRPARADVALPLGFNHVIEARSLEASHGV